MFLISDPEGVAMTVCNKYKQYQLYLHYLDLLPVPTGFAKPEERPYSSEEDSKLGSAG